MPETFPDLVNRVLRDHEGYSGDDFGNVGTLPVGDPNTASKPIVKRDLRQVLLAPESYAIRAELAAQAAEENANTQPVLFSSRAALAEALATLPQGATVLAEGQPYIVDNAATGYDSALQDLGMDGLRRADRLENFFLAAHFTTQDDTTVRFSVSLDGINFTSLNAAPLPGGQGYDLSQRDPAICFFEGYWWVFGTGGSAGNHDFVVYRSRDLTSWSKYQVAMQGGPYFSATVPIPGGTSPANAIWAPEPFIENGVMKVLISIRYGADFTNVYGAAQQHFRPYVTTLTNPDTMTFSAPEPMIFGPGDHTDGDSKIDPSVVKHGAYYYCAIKDSVYRRIQIYRATSLTGPWEFRQVLSGGTLEIEAPCLVRVRDRTAINTEARREKWRVYVDNNRTGVGDDSPNSLVGAPYYFETTGSPDNAYGAMKPMYFDRPVRHGSIINLAEAPPDAAERLTRVAAASGRVRGNLATEVVLSGGTTWIRPQPDVTYYVNVTSGATNLTVRDGPADRFYLAAYSGMPTVGINVLTGGPLNRGFLVGFGRGNDQVIEMRRRGSAGGYYPVGLARRDVVRAHKSADQNIASGSEVKLSFGVTAFNPTGTWSANRWTPPRGSASIRIRAVIAGLDAGTNSYLALRKTGTLVAQSFIYGEGSQATATLLLEDEYCSGTDYFEVFLLGAGPSEKIVRGATYATEFFGECW